METLGPDDLEIWQPSIPPPDTRLDSADSGRVVDHSEAVPDPELTGGKLDGSWKIPSAPQSGIPKTSLSLRQTRFESIIYKIAGNGLKLKATLGIGSERGNGAKARYRLDGR
jgi:hypothetical protein